MPLRLDELPTELIGVIINFVDLDDVAMLQATSRRMRAICRSAVLWRDLFLGSGPEHACKHAALLRRREDEAKRLAAAAAAAASNSESSGTSATTAAPQHVRPRPIKLRWDPVFADEPVSWYDEYIQRHAPIAMSWFELPVRAGSLGRRVGYRIDPADVLDVCGVALYWPGSRLSEEVCGGGGGANDDDRLSGVPPLLAVGPLEDGSVCMWDVNGTAKRRGAIVQRSAPGLLFGHTTGTTTSASAEHTFTAIESVSVDSDRHLGYFAMDTALVVVDLATLQVVGGESFARPVTALSAAHHSLPLTVGHDGGVCLYDVRTAQPGQLSVHDSCRGKTPNFPPASPLSILHMPEPGGGGVGHVFSHDLFVAGRVPTIFQYDRRHMAVPKDTIFSGATLCGLAAMPYPHPKPATGYDGQTGGQNSDSSSPRYRTLIACGEYKSKGSLELYAIGSGPRRAASASSSSSSSSEPPPPDPMINRQTSSSAKLLSVAAHGKRIMVSDGAGYVRWFERDGFREARRYEVHGGTYAYDSYGGGGGGGGGDGQDNGTTTAADAKTEIVRKLLPTEIPGNASHTSFSSNDVLVWTGSNLGLMRFSSQPGFDIDDFVQELQTDEERATEKKGFEYRAVMRQLFESARYFGGDDEDE